MNILTFDLEDWFHILDNNSTKGVKDWKKYESRIDIGIQHILDIIKSSNVSATFFVVGWIAKKYPNLIRKISNMGFEIASHSHLHQLVYQQNRISFANDLEMSIKTLEDCTGKKVTSFRAPGFSITKKNIWAFEVLYELGIEIDCSVFPARRAHGGMNNFKQSVPSIIKVSGNQIKEFPINTYNFLGYPIVFSGGGYFRLFPYKLIKEMTNSSKYVMSYFHPRDFDVDQPVINDLNYYRKFKTYVGLKKTKSKLLRWLREFEFIDLKTADRKVNWLNSPVVHF